MNDKPVAQLVASLDPIELDELDDKAKLHTRKDRKYLVSPEALEPVLADLSPSLHALQVGGVRWFSYGSLYFDTPDLISYRMAATRRWSRFKVRTRTYFDTETAMIEVKTKNRRGQTVKTRQPFASTSADPVEATRDFARRFSTIAPHAHLLAPLLAVNYRRATLAFPEPGIRATIDTDYRAATSDGAASCGDLHIVETKSSGKPGPLDRRLWRAGIRPVKISKYTTGLAAIRPDLPSNRWHRVLRNFSTEPSRTNNRPNESPSEQLPVHALTKASR